MEYCSWIYRQSFQELCGMDYCNGIQGFISYAISNLTNIGRGRIRCPCRKFQTKMFIDLGFFRIYLLQKSFISEFVPHKTMAAKIGRSTSSSKKVHGVIDVNTNPYRNMIMDTMRMN